MLFPIASEADGHEARAREDEAFKLFVALVKQSGTQLSSRMKKGIVCDALVLRECFVSAQQSMTFHGRGEASYLKQAAHCCFWIAKLKPLSLSIGAGEFAGQLVKGRRGWRRNRVDVNLIPAIEEALKADQVNGGYIFPLNEACGLQVGHHMAMVGLKQLSDRALHNDEHEKYESIEADIKRHNARFGESSKRLVKSLRFNNYSARATAAMFEWVYDRPEDKRPEERS